MEQNLLDELIGKRILIDWMNEQTWQHYKLIDYSETWLCLQGCSNGTRRYSGPEIYVPISQIKCIQEDK
jgi:hypothetical protein